MMLHADCSSRVGKNMKIFKGTQHQKRQSRIFKLCAFVPHSCKLKVEAEQTTVGFHNSFKFSFTTTVTF